MQKFRTVFVLGGPGSGKGTQSEKIQRAFPFKHLSAGQLLREEQNRQGSQFGSVIKQVILDGKIVPSHITIKLLQSAMQVNESKYRNFLIDGFPRNLQNFHTWKSSTKSFAECPFVLHFKCSEEEMIRRILKRSKSSQRSDDNMEIIHKRLKTYYTQTYQVIAEFQKQTKVHHIDSDPAQDQIFAAVKPIFQDFLSRQWTL